jgi:HNH endonuclease
MTCMAHASYAHAHTDRAEKAGQRFDYPLQDLRDEVAFALGNPCTYCAGEVTPQNFSIDHTTPTANGGSFSKHNTTVCCERSNRLKGQLTAEQFQHLNSFLFTIPASARADILRRLQAGGRVYFRAKP